MLARPMDSIHHFSNISNNILSHKKMEEKSVLTLHLEVTIFLEYKVVKELTKVAFNLELTLYSCL